MPRAKAILAPAAQRDLRHVLRRSAEAFGSDAAARYRALIKQALRDIEADPERPGSFARPDIMIAAARTYHISFSRTRVPGVPVKEPRHFLLYRRVHETIEVARIIHDARDLARHLPETFRR